MKREEVMEETLEGTSRAAQARRTEKLKAKKSQKVTEGVVGVKDRGCSDGRGEEMENKGMQKWGIGYFRIFSVFKSRSPTDHGTQF